MQQKKMHQILYVGTFSSTTINRKNQKKETIISPHANKRHSNEKWLTTNRHKMSDGVVRITETYGVGRESFNPVWAYGQSTILVDWALL